MTDLISRLRNAPRFGDVNLNDEAADEIERLRKQHAQAMADMDAEIDRLRAALRNLLDMDVAYMRGPKVEEAVEAALAALKEKLNERN